MTPEGQRVLEWARRIVGDTRTMREEIRAARFGLAGHVKIAAIPTALAMVSRLTTPFREKHPDVTFSITSRTSLEVLTLLSNFEIDVGISYLDNEPLGRVTSVPLYSERYQLITSAGNTYSDRDSVTWAEVGQLPLCLLTMDMQNRRLINKHLEEAGIEVHPTLEFKFNDRPVLAYPHGKMGQHNAAQPRSSRWDLPSLSVRSRLLSPMRATLSALWLLTGNPIRHWFRLFFTRRVRWR